MGIWLILTINFKAIFIALVAGCNCTYETERNNIAHMNNCNQRPPAVNDPATITTTHPETTNQTPRPTKEPIRRSRRIQQQKEQREI